MAIERSHKQLERESRENRQCLHFHEPLKKNPACQIPILQWNRHEHHYGNKNDFLELKSRRY